MVATLLFRDIGSGHRGLLDAREQKTPEQRRVVLTESPPAQIDDQNALLVHDATEVERLLARTGRDREAAGW